MKHTFTGNLVLQVEDEIIPLTCIEYNEIATASEYETLVLKGVGLLFRDMKDSSILRGRWLNDFRTISFWTARLRCLTTRATILHKVVVLGLGCVLPPSIDAVWLE